MGKRLDEAAVYNALKRIMHDDIEGRYVLEAEIEMLGLTEIEREYVDILLDQFGIRTIPTEKQQEEGFASLERIDSENVIVIKK